MRILNLILICLNANYIINNARTVKFRKLPIVNLFKWLRAPVIQNRSFLRSRNNHYSNSMKVCMDSLITAVCNNPLSNFKPLERVLSIVSAFAFRLVDAVVWICIRVNVMQQIDFIFRNATIYSIQLRNDCSLMHLFKYFCSYLVCEGPLTGFSNKDPDIFRSLILRSTFPIRLFS